MIQPTSATAKSLSSKLRYLKDFYEECKEISDIAQEDFFRRVRLIHSDINVFDEAFDPPASPIQDFQPGSTSEEVISKSHKKSNAPLWAKKTYRAIVLKTHPDRFPDDISESKKEKLISLYTRAAKSYEDQDYSLLTEVASELELDIELDIAEKVEYLKCECEKVEKDIQEIQSTVFWAWHHADNNQKEIILNNFVKARGWQTFSASNKKSRSGRHPGKSISWLRKTNLKDYTDNK